MNEVSYVTEKTLEESLEYLVEHIGADARIIYRGKSYVEAWAVDCLAVGGRSILGVGTNVYTATTNAVQEFYRRHPTTNAKRNSL